MELALFLLIPIFVNTYIFLSGDIADYQNIKSKSLKKLFSKNFIRFNKYKLIVGLLTKSLSVFFTFSFYVTILIWYIISDAKKTIEISMTNTTFVGVCASLWVGFVLFMVIIRLSFSIKNNRYNNQLSKQPGMEFVPKDENDEVK